MVRAIDKRLRDLTCGDGVSAEFEGRNLLRRTIQLAQSLSSLWSQRALIERVLQNPQLVKSALENKDVIEKTLNHHDLLEGLAAEFDLIREAIRVAPFARDALADRSFLTLVLENRDYVATQVSIKQSEGKLPPIGTGREQSHAAWIAKDGDRSLRLNYDLDVNSLVLDVGGYEGEWATEIFTRYACRIEIFEPVTSFADRIGSRFFKNPKVSVHAFGLGSETVEAKIGVTGDASSVVRGGDNAQPAEIRAFSDWHRSVGSPLVDLMKINIEGMEYALLEHLLETDLISQIGNLQIQFHDFVDGSDDRMRRIARKLRKTHLPTYRYRYVWENWRLREKGESYNLQLRYANLKNNFHVLNPDFVREIAEAFDLKAFIETGTYRGDTLLGIVSDFDCLVSIELDSGLHQRARERFLDQEKIVLLQGDSSEKLPEAFDVVAGRPALIWLDAHFSGPGTARGKGNTPIIGEIETVLACATPLDVVIVDDLRCFTQPHLGFATDEALEGYPAADEIADLFRSRSYEVLVVCDALIALPPSARDLVSISPVLRATTDLRLAKLSDDQRRKAQEIIAAATGDEAEALVNLPTFLAPHQRYGLGADYYFWRSLVGQRLQLDTVEADRDFAKRCGIEMLI